MVVLLSKINKPLIGNLPAIGIEDAVIKQANIAKIVIKSFILFRRGPGNKT